MSQVSAEHQSSAPMSMSDPYHEGIRNIDQVTFHRCVGSHLDITCCALVPKSASGKEWTNESVVTARLRMDVTMAKAFAEGLTKQIAMIEGAQGIMN